MIGSPAASGAVLGLAFAFGVLLIRRWVRARSISFDQRLAPYLVPRSRESGLLTEAHTITPFPTLERFVAPWITRAARYLERFGPGRAEVERRLVRAGGRTSLEQYRALQLVCGTLGLAGGLVLGLALHAVRGLPPALSVLLALVCAAGGVLACDQRLSAQITRRERVMLLELPTVTELMALAVGAGEAPLAALERVAATVRGETSEELRWVLGEIHAGVPFTTALESLATRTSLLPLAQFLHGVSVAVDRGTPLAEVLRAQAGDAREATRRELMEIGGRNEVLMMIPVVFLILPITILFALFPSVLTLQLGP
ncbi:MAG: type II secretion system F family protein [Cellulomonadaceae bacterium]